MGTPGSGYGHPSSQKSQMAPPPPPPPSSATPAASSAAPASALDQPAQPAKVELTSGKLTIQADNSSLTAILNQLSTSAGMTIDGLNKDERIFGTYGPGDPREILSTLLEGSGYNVMMLGRTNSGTPSQLTLSLRQSSPAGAEAQRNQQRPPEEEDEEPAPTQYEDAAPPNSQQPAPGTQANPQGNGVKTPQQMLQELQTIRQQQQQQQQPQNPQ